MLLWSIAAPVARANPDLGPLLTPGMAELAHARLGPLEQLPTYDLSLDVDPESGRFALRQRLTLRAGSSSFDEVHLVVYANAAGAQRPDGSPAISLAAGRCLPPHACQLSPLQPDGSLRVALDEPVAPGGELTVELNLHGVLPRFAPDRTSFDGQMLETLGSLARGAQPHDFGLLALGDGIVSMGGFLAVPGPRHGGIWDLSPRLPLGDLTSDDLSNVHALVRLPVGYRVATPGLVLEARSLDDGRVQHEISAPLVRDFALITSKRFLTRERRVGNVNVRTHLATASDETAGRVLAAASDALELFQATFGPYPYRELDVAEAPLVGGVGGVEFSGLVTVATMTLEEPAASPLAGLLSGLGSAVGMSAEELGPSRKGMLDMVVAHEVAHQWWHVLIGSDSRRDPFVDEGLAQWSALYFLEQKRGRDSARRTEKQLALSYQTMRLLGEADRPVDRPVDSFRTTLAYGGLVYGKGPLVYRELRRSVGSRLFLATLKQYSERYALRVAPRAAFIEMLALAAPDKPVRSIAQRWLEQTHGDEDLGTLQPGLGGLGDSLGKLRGAQGTPGSSADLMGLLKQLLEAAKR